MDPLEHVVRTYGRDGATAALHSFLDQLPVCCIIKDEALRYCVVNQKFSALLGLTPAEMLGRRAVDLFPLEVADRFERRERDVIENGRAIDYEETVVTPEGEARDFIAQLRPMETEDGRRFVCVSLSDVTELSRARAAAKSADRLKSEFLATMSHELRTPMHGVLGLARLLNHGEVDDRQSALIDRIITCGQSLMSIIDDVLDFSTLEAGQVRLKPEPFELFAAVEDVAAMLTPEAEAKGLRLYLAIGGPAPARVIGDVARIKQILANFIANAIKFSDAGDIRVEIDCAPGEDATTPMIRFTVADQGIGIREEDQEAIFTKFRQIDGSATRTRQGIGLGLAISASLAELMGGEVSVKSALGEGAAFTLAVPLTPAETHASQRHDLRARVIDPCAGRGAALSDRLRAKGVQIAEDEEAVDLTLVALDHAESASSAAMAIASEGPETGRAAILLPMTAPLEEGRRWGGRTLHSGCATLTHPVGEADLDTLLRQVAISKTKTAAA